MKIIHEELGIKYLIEKLGYKRKGIIINPASNTNGLTKRGSPDLTTTLDGKEWEVKQLENMSRITFTLDQYKRFDENVNVLIFKNHKYIAKGEDPFIVCAKFGDIRNQTENFGYIANSDGKRYDIRFMVRYEIDMCIAEGVSSLITYTNDGVSFFLSSNDVGMREKYEYIARHPKDHVVNVLKNTVGMGIDIDDPLEILLDRDSSINVDKLYNAEKNELKI